MRANDCPLCNAASETVIWQDAHCRVVVVDEPHYPGFCRVIWQAHVREMTDLNADDRRYFIETVFTVERGLRALLQPEKINLASLGNLVPHLHWHVIPRFRDDPHFPDPIWSSPKRAPTLRGFDILPLKQYLLTNLKREYT